MRADGNNHSGVQAVGPHQALQYEWRLVANNKPGTGTGPSQLGAAEPTPTSLTSSASLQEALYGARPYQLRGLQRGSNPDDLPPPCKADVARGMVSAPDITAYSTTDPNPNTTAAAWRSSEPLPEIINMVMANAAGRSMLAGVQPYTHGAKPSAAYGHAYLERPSTTANFNTAALQQLQQQMQQQAHPHATSASAASGQAAAAAARAQAQLNPNTAASLVPRRSASAADGSGGSGSSNMTYATALPAGAVVHVGSTGSVASTISTHLGPGGTFVIGSGSSADRTACTAGGSVGSSDLKQQQVPGLPPLAACTTTTTTNSIAQAARYPDQARAAAAAGSGAGLPLGPAAAAGVAAAAAGGGVFITGAHLMPCFTGNGAAPGSMSAVSNAAMSLSTGGGGSSQTGYQQPAGVFKAGQSGAAIRARADTDLRAAKRAVPSSYRPSGQQLHQDSSSGSSDASTRYLECEEQLATPGGEAEQLRNRAAGVRAGAPSYPATAPPAHPAHHYHFQLPLMYVYRPLTYPDHVSAAALAQANQIMTKLTIPGGITFMPVQPSSCLFRDGARFGFTAFSITLGSSYFQRLVASMPHLEYAVRRSGPAYQHYLSALPHCSDRRWAALHGQYGSQYGSASQVTEEATLLSIQFTCVYLACKVVDRMPMLDMLRYILTHLYGSVVSKAQAYDVESKCLEGLGFRLGPYFSTDDLQDDWPY